MSKAKKKTNAADGDAPLSSGEIAVGIACLLVLMITCFGFGVYVGRFMAGPLQDKEIDPTRVADNRNKRPDPAASQSAKNKSPNAQGTQTYPRRLAHPAAPYEVQKAPGKPSSAPGTSKTKPSSKQVDAAKPKIQLVKLPAPQPLKTPEEPKTPKTASTLPSKKPPVEKASATEKKPPKEEPAPAQVAAKGMKYTIQVGAYTIKKNAEDAKKRLEANTSYKARFKETKKHTLLQVGQFTDSKSAEKVRDELRRDHKSLGDCFVKELR